MAQLDGRIDEAIDRFQDCLTDNTLEIAHKIFHIELAFCFALKCDWDQAIRFAALVRKNGARHSASVVTYIEAILRYAKSVDDNDEQQKQRASELFQFVFTFNLKVIYSNVLFVRQIHTCDENPILR